ncbi:hypothetical protein bcgnr5378_07870 [Bacillus cereus]
MTVSPRYSNNPEPNMQIAAPLILVISDSAIPFVHAHHIRLIEIVKIENINNIDINGILPIIRILTCFFRTLYTLKGIGWDAAVQG